MSQDQINENLDNFGINFVEFIRILDRQKNLLITTAVITFISGITYTFFQRINNPTYVGNFSLLVEDPFKKNEENRGENFFEDIASNRTANDIPTIIEVLKSKPLLNNTLRSNNLAYDELLSALVITKGGNIKNIREEAKGILEISYYGKDKSQIFSVLNDLSKDYISYSLKQKQDRIQEGLEFLNSQNPNLQKKINEIQLKIKNIRTNSSGVDPKKQTDLFNELITKLDNEKKALQFQLESFIAFKSKIENSKNYNSGFENSILLPEGKFSSDVSGLSSYFSSKAILIELDILKKKLASSRTIFKPEAEIIISLEKKIKSLSNLAKESQLNAVESAIYDINSKIDQVNKSLTQVLIEYKKLPDFMNEYEKLKQDLELAKENYISFTKTKEKFRLGIAQNNFPWEVINPPSIEEKPVKPNIIKRLYQFTFLSFFIGVIFALFKDRIENFYHSPNEIKEKLNLNIYGSIPYLENIDDENFYSSIKEISSNSIANMNKKDLINMRSISKDFYLHREAYRYLVNNLELIKERKKFKIINLTSTIQGEGKTQTSIDLSKTFNSLNKKVLLIDGDLRKPRIHSSLGLKNKTGLSKISELNESSYQSLIQKVDNYKNLDIITSGPKLGDPFKIFNSNDFKKFLAWLENLNEYEYIIFDSPLALFLADTNLLSNKVDYTLLVISLFKVERDLVNAAINNIHLSNGKILGVISVDSKQNNSFGYKYNYGNYRYGYGYLNNEKIYKKDSQISFFAKYLKKIREFFT